MGIPKFYRWLSERYPLLNQRIKGTEGPPEIDNLFLDMNGIIHNCTHANQTEVKLTEEEMMLRIFDYIDKLVQIIRPRKSLFMAIDGVAPRAKMNQQRSRRFKAAKERVEALEELRKKGEVVPDNPFDSNCITPGTPFMDRLGKHLRFFIRKKISEDPVWQAPCVIFSGHEVPGEGEHKIMEFLRWERRNPGYQPNQRHCLYGLDADLVMLSLVTHEPHFCLLREVVSYSGGNRGQPAREVLENPCADNFILFHISLLREYLDLEYSTVVLPWNDGGRPDVERIVDDFVLFCMLIGNDFLPALPTLDIGEGALNAIMTIYKELLPTLGGYLTWAGQLDRSRLEQVLSRLGHMEQEVLEERAKDAEFMEGKRAKRAGNGGNGRNAGSAPYTPPAIRSNNGHGPGGTRTAAGPGGASAGFGARRGRAQVVEDGVDVSAAEMAGLRLDSSVAAGALPGYFGLVPGAAPVLAVLAAALEEEEAVVPIVSAEPTMMSKEARQLMLSGQGQQGLEMWKARWYEEKLGAFNAEERRKVTEAYLAGVHWVLEYYYRGVASWDWYYPYYFAPMASELRQLEDITVTFRQGTPFRPYEQLLAVLPSASAVLLPPAFQHLMLDPHSPILDFYPQEFEVDMEGKRASWEGVVKVPFVDEARLLAAVYSVDENKLQADERARNMLGEILVFTYKAGSQETDFCQSTMPKAFRDVLAPESQMLRRPMPPPLPGTERGFKPELVSGTRTGLGVPYGLPTLRTISVVGSMRMAGVNVLGMPSKKESLLLALTNAGGNFVITADSVKDIMLGVRCFVNWPYLREARVMRVSDPTEQWYLTGHAEKQNKKWQSQEASKWRSDVNALVGALLVNHGIEVGKVDVVMHVRMCKGYLQLPDGSVQKQFFDEEVLFPLQCAVRRRPGEVEAAPAIGGSDLPPQEPLKEGDRVVYLGKAPHYGCVAIVLPDLGQGLTAAGKVVKPAGPAKSYRIAVQALGAAGDPMRTVARRVVTASEPRYLSSSDVARRVGCNGRVLGRITGNVWVSAGEERFDVGLSVRAARQMLCVPGYAAPSTEGSGWMYSQGLVTLLQEYQAKHNWLWKALAQQSMVEETGGNSLRAADMLPDLTPDERKAKVTAAVKWVKACPLSTKPLVKASVMLMTDEGVRMLQQATPMPVHCPPVEYERVPPALLMPPFQPGPDQVKLSVQGGVFALGDRVVCLLKAGIPAFGLHGTVIGVYDEALEVLFDKEFTGGSTLNGRVNSKCGAYVPNDVLLNTSIPTTLPLNKSSAPQQVQSGAHPVNTGTAQKDQSRPTSAVGQAGGARPSAAPKVLMGRAAVPSSGGRHGAEGAASQAVQSTQNHAALPSTTVVQKAAPAVHALPHATYLPTPFLSSPPPVVFDAVVAPAEAGPPPPPPSALLMAKARAAKARSAQPRPAPAQPMAAVAAAAVAAAIRQVLPAPAPVPPQRAAGMQDRPFDAGEGAALLGRLQAVRGAGAGLAAPNPAAPHPTLPTVGTILLNQLQQGARGAGVPLVEAPRTPPSAAPPAHAFPGPDQAGAVLLHQLRNGAADLQQVRPASQHPAQQPQPQMHHPGMPVQAPVGQVMGPGTMPMLYGGGPPVGMQASHPALVHAQIQIQQQIQQVQQVQQQLRQQAQHHQQQVQHHQQQYQQQQPQFFQHRTTHQYQQLQPSFQQLQPPFQQLQPPFQQLQPPYQQLQPPFQQLQPPFQQLQPPYQQLQPPLQQLQPPYQQLQPPYQQLQPQTQDQQHLALPPTAASAATQNTALEPSQI